MSESTKKLTIKTFEANRDMAACLEFSEGYFKILSDQGINSYLTSHTWMQTDGIYGVQAYYQDQVVGGVILCKPLKGCKFPYEDLISPPKKSPKIKPSVQPENTGELFALWHSASAAGWGLSYILLKAGLALSHKLGLSKTLYLAAEYNLRLADKLGFKLEKKNGVPVFYTFQEASLNTKIYLNYYATEDDMFASEQKAEILEMANSGISHKLEKVLSKKFDIEYII